MELEAHTGTMANTTISTVETGEKTSALRQFISPPTYNPCTDSAQSFMTTYDQMAVANNWNDVLKILYFHSFLQGAANIWYTEYKEGHPDSNWPLICQAFKNEFCNDNSSLRLLAKVRERTQGPLEPTKNYFYNLRVLYKEYKREVDFGEFHEIFQNGLTAERKARYYWLTHFPNQPPRSLEEIKLLCITIDNAPTHHPYGPLHQHSGQRTCTVRKPPPFCRR